MSVQPAKAIPFPEAPGQPSDRSFTKRWKHQKLFDKGFVVIPSRFLQLYARLKPFPLSAGEALFVLHLMEFKWDANHPFPGYKTIAARMGVSDKMARRYAQSLEIKRYLRREKRIGQTNRFDLTPLFDALAKAIDQESTAESRAKANKQTDTDRLGAMLSWHAKVVDAYAMISEEDMKKIEEWKRSGGDGKSVNTVDWPGWVKYVGPKPE